MFNLPHFKEKDLAIVKQFMRANPFAFLTGCDAVHQPVATQVPLLLEERADKLFLLGHVQRKTDHQLAFEHNPHVLAIFTGPHSYVSASWYPNPRTPSTWNYIAVHAKGLMRFLAEDDLHAILTRTTALFENDPHSPALVDKIPAEDVRKMMKAIIAFEIEISHLDNVFKLSQNRDEKTYDAITESLHAGDAGAAAIGNEMEQRRSQLFNNQKGG